MQKPSVNAKIYNVIGLMSGTSLDGIDAALIRTDGQSLIETIDFVTLPYGDDLRRALHNLLGVRDRNDQRVPAVEREMRRQAAEQDAQVLHEHGPADDLDDLVQWSGTHLEVED